MYVLVPKYPFFLVPKYECVFEECMRVFLLVGLKNVSEHWTTERDLVVMGCVVDVDGEY